MQMDDDPSIKAGEVKSFPFYFAFALITPSNLRFCEVLVLHEDILHSMLQYRLLYLVAKQHS